MTTLKQARDKGKLEEFIKEHESAPTGDLDALNRALKSMAGKSPEAPAASPKEDRDD